MLRPVLRAAVRLPLRTMIRALPGSDPFLSISPEGTVAENVDTHAVFIIRLTSPAVDDVALDLAIVGSSATAGTDFTDSIEVSTDNASWGANTSVTIATGETTVYARVPILDDAEEELEEFIRLEATVSSGTTFNPTSSGLVRITSDEVYNPYEILPGVPDELALEMHVIAIENALGGYQ